MTKKERALETAKIFEKEYPDPVTELNYKNEYQLTVAVALSAQTTDIKVNEVTKKLFKKYPSWESLANAHIKDIQNIIRPVNFYIGKSERLITAAQVVITKFAGRLPKNLKDLIQIPGVARKSANVILKELWGKSEGVVVDTHIKRLSGRLDLTNEKSAKKIEKDLMDLLPKKYWLNFSGAGVLHGRYICTARKPKCEDCVLNKICPGAFNF